MGENVERQERTWKALENLIMSQSGEWQGARKEYKQGPATGCQSGECEITEAEHENCLNDTIKRDNVLILLLRAG